MHIRLAALEKDLSSQMQMDLDTRIQMFRAQKLAERAAKQRRRAPSLFEAIILATARVYDSKVPTGDEHFEWLPETIRIWVVASLVRGSER